MSHTYAGHSKGEEGPYDPEFPEGEKSLDLEKLICPKCGEEFPATTDRGPGPAKAKFAAHVNKCEGKKQEEPLFSAVPGCLACSDVIPGDIIPATKDRK